MDYSRHILTTYQYNSKIHLGHKGDWGGVVANCETKYDYYICLGIWGDEKFTQDFIETQKIDTFKCFMFDVYGNGRVTSEIFSKANKDKNTYMDKIKIQSVKINKDFNLGFLLNSCKNAFVRVDMEGKEYDWIHSLTKDQLNNIQQLYIQVYDYNDKTFNEVDFYNRLRSLEKLTETHYLVHAHSNNHYPMHKGYMADTFKLNYIRKDEYKRVMGNTEPPLYNITPLPTSGLDYAHDINNPELFFMFPPFYNLPKVD